MRFKSPEPREFIYAENLSDKQIDGVKKLIEEIPIYAFNTAHRGQKSLLTDVVMEGTAHRDRGGEIEVAAIFALRPTNHSLIYRGLEYIDSDKYEVEFHGRSIEISPVSERLKARLRLYSNEKDSPFVNSDE